MLPPGFEPGAMARKAIMFTNYTKGATAHYVSRMWSNTVVMIETVND